MFTRVENFDRAGLEALWAEFELEVGVRLIDKTSAQEMQAVSDLLEMMGIMEAETFLNNYATTVGRSVYIPFEFGDADSRALVDQAATLTHETQHAVQFMRGGTEFITGYALDEAKRASAEAEAIQAGNEVRWILSGKLSDPVKAAARLEAYKISSIHRDTVASMLKLSFQTIRSFGVTTEAGKIAWEYFCRECMEG